MSDIEVGEYIRTRYGVIAKLEYIEEDADEEYKFYVFDNTLYRDYGEPIDFLREDEIESDVKAHSKNIIDLIEEGDIVEIQNKLDGVKTIFDLNKYTIDIYKEQIKNESIKILSIVTKEQFNSIKYEVE